MRRVYADDVSQQIQQDAFDGSKWGVDRLIANKGVQTVTIPKCIAPGQYLLRGELIALHSASSSMGAQFYMVRNSLHASVTKHWLSEDWTDDYLQECAQINIVGGSADKTPATVSFPGAYKQNDAGIIYNRT
jgi:hypothetical protein